MSYGNTQFCGRDRHVKQQLTSLWSGPGICLAVHREVTALWELLKRKLIEEKHLFGGGQGEAGSLGLWSVYLEPVFAAKGILTVAYASLQRWVPMVLNTLTRTHFRCWGRQWRGKCLIVWGGGTERLCDSLEQRQGYLFLHKHPQDTSYCGCLQSPVSWEALIWNVAQISH